MCAFVSLSLALKTHMGEPAIKNQCRGVGGGCLCENLSPFQRGLFCRHRFIVRCLLEEMWPEGLNMSHFFLDLS